MCKVIFFVKSLDGGTGTFIEQLSTIRQNGNLDLQVQIVSLEKPSFRKTKIPAVYCHPSNFFSEKYSFSFSFLRNVVEEILWFRSILKNEKPTVVLTVDMHCLFIAIWTKLIYDESFSIIATIHNNLVSVIHYKIPLFIRWIVEKSTGLLLRRSDRIVCVSKELAESLAKHFKLVKKPTVIYYELSDKFKQGGERKQLKDDKNIILSVGRFYKQKDYQTIITAYSQLSKELKKQSPLWLVGDGPIREELENYVASNNIDGVHFIGWVQNQTEVLNKAALFVFSSNWEGFGYTIIEAMSQGLPVIATDTPFGPQEILQDGEFGILVPMKDPQKMASAMEQLLTDKDLYEHYSQKSLERARDFAEGKMVQAYEALLLEVCNL